MNPEHYIIGEGLYGGCESPRAVAEDGVFRIEPRPVPVLGIVLADLIFLTFYTFVYLFVRHNAPDNWSAHAIIACFAGGTCLSFSLVYGGMFYIERKRGDWLVYDKVTRMLTLPRHRLNVPLAEIDHLQYLTGWSLLASTWDPNQVSELNLMTMRAGKRESWNILKSGSDIGVFEQLLKPFIEQTPIPIIRVKETVRGKEVTITPWEQVLAHMMSWSAG